MSELVSIITPSYNSAAYIAEMIESILAQTYTNWELLITDDCSTDDSVKIIESYATKDSRIKLFRLASNSGAGIARNKSIEEARGRYIAFCDSDDLWKPQKLEKQVEFSRKNHYAFTFCQSEVIDCKGNIIGFNKRKPKVTFSSTKIINYIGTSGVLLDTKEIGKFYMPPIRRRQDWALWLDILKVTHNAHCYGESLGYVRTGNKASLSGKKFKLPKYHIAIYHNHLGYPKIIAILMFLSLNLPCTLFKKAQISYQYKKFVQHLISCKLPKNIYEHD